ncbi:RND transporter [Defluviimonas sp. 20V17]|nr:RND transporter [Defluviimonas sp. 20V17]
MWKRMLVMLGGLAILAVVLAFGFYLHVKALMASAPKPGAVTVSDTVVRPSAWQSRMKAVGTLSAVHGVELTTQVAGVIKTIAVRSGAQVRAGEVLVTLDAAPEEAQLASLQAAADLAHTTLERARRLMTGQTVTQAAIDADEANLKVKQALVDQQKALIAQKTLRAPFSGRLGILQVNLGQYLTPGTRIASLQDLRAMHDDFVVPQIDIARLSRGQPVSVRVDAYAGRVFHGQITAINSEVDLNTRNVTVRATVPNPDGLLRPGMFVHTEVTTGAPRELLTLPASAITYNSYGASVYVVVPAKTGTGKIVQQVFVTTGPTRGDQVTVLNGLKAGQTVVTSGQLKLSPGAAVRIDNAVQPPDAVHPKPAEQ